MKHIAIIGNTIESKLSYLLIKKENPSWNITIFTNNQPFQNHFHTGLEKPVTGLAFIKLLRQVGISIQEYLNATATTFGLAIEYLNLIDKPLYRIAEPNIGSIENIVFEYMQNIVGNDLRNTVNQNQPTITVLGDLAKISEISKAEALQSYCHYLIDNDLDLLENLFLFLQSGDDFPHYDSDIDTDDLNGIELIQRLSNQFIAGKTRTNLNDSIDHLVWNHDIEGLNSLLDSKIPLENYYTDNLTDIITSTDTNEESNFGQDDNFTTITINGQKIDFVIDTLGDNESLLALLPPFVHTNNICNRIYFEPDGQENFNKNKFTVTIGNDSITFSDPKLSSRKNIFFQKTTTSLDLPYKDINTLRPRTIISNFASNDINSSDLPYSNYLLFSLEKYALEPFSFHDINTLVTMAVSLPRTLTKCLEDVPFYGSIILGSLQHHYQKIITDISNINLEMFQGVSSNFLQQYQDTFVESEHTLPDLNASTFNEIALNSNNDDFDCITNAWDRLLIRYQKNKLKKSNLALNTFAKAYYYERERKKYLFRTPLNFYAFRKLFLG